MPVKIFIRLLNQFALVMLLFPNMALPAGSYDGVWLGDETLSIPLQGISETGQTVTIIYQDVPDSLWIVKQEFQNLENAIPLQLLKQGGRWVLPAPTVDTVFGYQVAISSLYFEFTSLTQLLGSYNLTYTVGSAPYAGSGALSHTKQSCATLPPSTQLVNLSGLEGSLRCYGFQLPSCTSLFRVTTRNGSGDVNLHAVYGKPDFSTFSSRNLGNDETVIPTDQTGLWYVVLEGFKAYTGVTLEAVYTIADEDADGVSDCADLCPNTPANTIVDADGCSMAQLRQNTIVPIINLLLLGE